ncbi:MAG TPA: hypothetical protein H9898_03670 [Candidatus Anaerobiospirillum stercoravium]|nr:hypothetical protein [Candidatus Anaerobiospirillum stercoravium]
MTNISSQVSAVPVTAAPSPLSAGARLGAFNAAAASAPIPAAGAAATTTLELRSQRLARAAHINPAVQVLSARTLVAPAAVAELPARRTRAQRAAVLVAAQSEAAAPACIPACEPARSPQSPENTPENALDNQAPELSSRTSNTEDHPVPELGWDEARGAHYLVPEHESTWTPLDDEALRAPLAPLDPECAADTADYAGALAAAEAADLRRLNLALAAQRAFSTKFNQWAQAQSDEAARAASQWAQAVLLPEPPYLSAADLAWISAAWDETEGAPEADLALEVGVSPLYQAGTIPTQLPLKEQVKRRPSRPHAHGRRMPRPVGAKVPRSQVIIAQPTGGGYGTL